jgi:hypothetical protein
MGNRVGLSPFFNGCVIACRLPRSGAQSVLPQGTASLILNESPSTSYGYSITAQSLLWMEPDHPIIILRLAFVFLCALPAVRELYQYINDPR